MPEGTLSLQAEGVIGWVGVGTPDPIIAKYIASGEIDVALVASCYDLLDRSAAETILPLAAERNVGVVIGGPYGTGILATGAVPGAKYRYRDAPPEILDRVRPYERVCREFGVLLRAVALRFCLRHPAVHAVIPGMGSPHEVEAAVATFDERVPDDLWAALDDHESAERGGQAGRQATPRGLPLVWSAGVSRARRYTARGRGTASPSSHGLPSPW